MNDRPLNNTSVDHGVDFEMKRELLAHDFGAAFREARKAKKAENAAAEHQRAEAAEAFKRLRDVRP